MMNKYLVNTNYSLVLVFIFPLVVNLLFHYFIQDHAIARVTVHSNQETIHAAPN